MNVNNIFRFYYGKDIMTFDVIMYISVARGRGSRRFLWKHETWKGDISKVTGEVLRLDLGLFSTI